MRKGVRCVGNWGRGNRRILRISRQIEGGGGEGVGGKSGGNRGKSGENRKKIGKKSVKNPKKIEKKIEKKSKKNRKKFQILARSFCIFSLFKPTRMKRFLNSSQKLSVKPVSINSKICLLPFFPQNLSVNTITFFIFT